MIYITQVLSIIPVPRRGGASHEQICDFGIMGMWHLRVPKNHHDLHPLPGWTHMHILGEWKDLQLRKRQAVASEDYQICNCSCLFMSWFKTTHKFRA